MERSIENLQFRLTVPGYQMTGGLPIEFHEDGKASPNWARVVIPDELLNKISGTMECVLEIGSDEDFETLLEGTGKISDKQEDVLIIRNDLEILRNIRICNTFLNCRPQEAVRYILTVAGIEDYRMTDEDIGSKDVFTISDMDGLSALKEINTIFGIDISFNYEDGTFWWGVIPDQDEVASLTDDNVMSLKKTGELWEADILTIPIIRTGDLISVECEEYTGFGMVTKRILKSDGRQIDMYINFEEEDLADE